MLTRAYSILDIKSVHDDARLLEGIATTPSPDRMNDVIESDGIQFKLPLPLLYQHNSKQPIGTVTEAKVTKSGIRVKAQMAPAGVAPFIDEAWALIKAGLIRGLSIGFRSLEDSFNKETGGFHFLRTEWMELSAVTIPANSDATILTVKSLDSGLAASGNSQPAVVRLGSPTTPGVTGNPQGQSMKPIAEQITAFENKRAALEARQNEIMSKSADEGRTLEETESQEYDGLTTELKAVDDHLVRLRAHEKQLVASAAAVTKANASTAETASVVRGGGRSVIEVSNNDPKGVGMARLAICLLNAKGNPAYAINLAERNYRDRPEVALAMKSIVEAGDTTTSGWASQLVPAAIQMQNEFLGLLRPATILGKIPNLRNVPFNVAVPVQSGGGTYSWVGEAAAKPVTSATFTSVTLRWAKAAGIIVITKELAKFSSPSAEAIIRDEMIAGCRDFIDTQFVGTAAAVSNVSPAGILNTISAVASTGTTAATFRTNMNDALNNFAANNVDPSGLVILMSATTAIALSLMHTSLGVTEFPSLSVQGGSILGLPVIVSENVGNKIILLNSKEILVAEDGGISIDVSDQATIEMDTVPALGESSPTTQIAALKSFWQNNLIGLRVERFITWARGRTSAVEYISGVAYVP